MARERPGNGSDTPDGTQGAGLLAEGVTVERGGRRLLDDVHLRADPGQVLAVTGPSGAGKSTLLAVLGSLVRPQAGSVSWRGEPVRVADTRPGRTVGVVLQGYGLLPVLTARENAQLPLQIAGRPRAEVVSRAAEALELAGLGEDQLPHDRLAEELSGGQLQRVAVARALVVEPDLLLADEPTSELDAATRDVVLKALRAVADRGGVVVLATHDPEVAATCDVEVALADGRVTAVRATSAGGGVPEGAVSDGSGGGVEDDPAGDDGAQAPGGRHPG
jgi:putative ABC transport system ATP-binding protein